MTIPNPNSRVQRGPPPDPRHAIRRAHQQPRTGVTEANRGSSQQPRTGMLQANRGKHKINKSFNICTYNTRTINDLNEDALEIMLHELDDIKWDIVGLAETKMKESKIQYIEESGHQLFFSGNDISRSHGVGFLVNKSIIPIVNDYDPISDRLAVLKLNGKFSKINIIQCYFPTTKHPDEEVIKLYDQIQDIVDATPKRDHLIVMGDFNSKVGGLHTTYPSAIGKHTIGSFNTRGELLAKFCVRNGLIATNTMFQKRKHYTWTSPDGNTKNQIDFILTRSSSSRQNITNSTVLNSPDISDHRLVRTTIKLKFSWPNKTRNQQTYDLEKLKDLGTKESFQLELSNRFTLLSEESDTNTLYEEITSAINSSISNNLPPKDKTYSPWMSHETQKAITNKHQIRKHSGQSSPEYKIAKAETKKLVKKDKMKQMEK